MPIRPVDYTSLVPKVQEVSRIKQIEYDKIKIQMEHGIIQNQKQIAHNIKKVRDTNKTEDLVVDPNKERQDNNNKYYAKKEQDNIKKKENKDKKEEKNIGKTIDIRI
ncbi:hypothetical protein EDD65_105160 [Keratinibaculum paraultunense]|uniref:Uncharacterized protein n=1 Tax=Keratinibaculum paraultunense TaxID=1278232 RepID=A0A4R3KX08_9FIRM|nr:hypothetical protein [Keratinibaculum paraultunense]QQY80709.1 hypothetical protein JL105_05280 [Keratinibaculum paraultunense]TCS89686.1 hypothetical protein EDD65_105160 [Keratinibaculum paraultunense]